MTILNTDISKFSFAESVSSSNGKTSGSKVAGALVVTSGCFSFIMSSVAAIAKDPNAIALAGIAAGVITAGLVMFGYSKKRDTLGKSDEESNTNINIKQE